MILDGATGVRPNLGAEHPVVRAYISIVKKYGRTWFGIRIHWFGEVVFEPGWFGTQKVNAQMIALDCLLRAIEMSGIDVRLEVIFRTDYIGQRLSMAQTRKTREQHGLHTRPMKEDAARWKDVATRVQASGTKIGMALKDRGNPRVEFYRSDTG